MLISGPTGPVLARRRPSPCRAPDVDCPRADADQRHRDEHPVTATTNAALNVCILDEGFVGKIDDGQHTGADRSVISHRLYRFYTWCADAAVPELERLARTIQTWWSAIEAFLHTKITNAASEGYNRIVKLDARNAYGYRNPANQRLRTRCATTRRVRGCLNPDQLR